MTKAEQKKFARDLSRNVANRFADLVTTGRVPKNWTGHEIRCWFSDTHRQDSDMSRTRKEPRSKRAKEYKNDILIHNL